MYRAPAGQRRTDRSGVRGAAGLAYRRLLHFGGGDFRGGNVSLGGRRDFDFLSLDGLRLLLDCDRRGIVRGAVTVHWGLLAVKAPQPDRDVFVDRAGMRLLLRNAKLWQALQNFVSLDFQFPCQLVDSNLLHR
jgi:hypothetical protein